MRATDELDDLDNLVTEAPPMPEAPTPAEPTLADSAFPASLVIGELIGMLETGMVPLVTFAGRRRSAVAARTVVDLDGSHIGKHVALAFEGGDPGRPIVMGVIRDPGHWPFDSMPAGVRLEADNSRLVVSATDQIVLRCGKAKLTLTKEGKVLVEGSYVSIHSSGVNRLKGGSVQIN